MNDTMQKIDDAITANFSKLDITKFGPNARTIGITSTEKGLNLKDFGAAGDGNDATPAFIAMFAMGAVRGIYEYFVPDGRYGITQRINVPRNSKITLANNATIYPRANVDIVKMAPNAVWSGGFIDLKSHSLVPNWDKVVFYFDATDMYQLYEQRHEVCDVNIQGEPKNADWKGTAFKCHASLPDTYINNIQFNRIMITNIGTGFHFRVEPTITDPAHPSWVNACDGAQIGLQNFEYGFKFEGLKNVPRDVGGNIFRGLQLQAEVGTKHMIYCESALNRWDGFFWDLHKMVDTNQAFYFTEGSRFNEVKSAMASELTESWYDKGYLNSFPSPNSYTADKRVNAMPISTPGYPNFLGDQDDWLIYGDTRTDAMMTVTNVTPATPSIPVSGTLTDILQPDTEVGLDITMTNSDYDHPAIIEIDLGTSPCWYGSYFTAIFAWGKVPKGLKMEVFDALSNGGEWIWFHEIKENTSQNVIVSPPYSMGSKITKLRLSMYGYNPTKQAPTNKIVTLARVMLTSQKDPGKAFLPSNYKVQIIQPDAPPTYAGQPYPDNDTTKGRIVGDQEDFLVAADKKYTVASTGKALAAGQPWHLFRRDSGSFARWQTPDATNKAVVEITFPNGIDFLRSFGVSFIDNELAKNVTFFYQTAAGGTWTQNGNYTNNASSTVHRAINVNKIYGLKVEMHTPTNANGYIKVCRLFATTQSRIDKGFVAVDTGGKVYDDIEIGEIGKGIIMKTPDGTKRYRITIDNNGALITTLI